MAKKQDKADTEPEESSGGSMAVNDAWTGLLAISLLALMTGAGFLGWDYWQYYDDKDVPRPPYLSGKGPGAPAVNKPPEKKPEEPKDQKKDDKKDAARRHRLESFCLQSPTTAIPTLSARTRSPIPASLL
ncbi:MAG: hypothetical protein EXR98_09425 [Gemmataceae bacterium]|nr:hypothetical protein [Gemmataceae bacterium]